MSWLFFYTDTCPVSTGRDTFESMAAREIQQFKQKLDTTVNGIYQLLENNDPTATPQDECTTGLI